MDPEQVLNIIAQEVGVARHELQDDTEFADLGIDQALAKAITDRIAAETSQRLPISTFETFQDVQSLVQHLDGTRKIQPAPNPTTKKPASPQKKSMPLVLPLQGNPATAKLMLFLMPDGGGSGMAYARLPRLSPEVALYGLNSPFLGMDSFSGTIEDVSATFAAAIRKLQPRGPYLLGGWSAGGYFATEVARLLVSAGEVVESIVLIDSPCRLEYEAMPLEVVRYLAPRNLMGNWGDKDTPKWLLNHFEGILAAVDRYMPVPVRARAHAPAIFIIEAAEAIFDMDEEFARSGLDPNNNLSRRLLVSRKAPFNPHGWERLFPGSKLQWARSPGTHFTMVHPPHSEALGALLRDIVGGQGGVENSPKWSEWRLEDHV